MDINFEIIFNSDNTFSVSIRKQGNDHAQLNTEKSK